MARFSSIIYGLIFVAVTLVTAAAQTARPGFPGPRPLPNANQAGQTNPPAIQNGPVVAPNGAQQPNQQPPNQQSQGPARQPDLPPTTPAVAPVVTYRDGLLTVQAINSNLSAVVTAIRNKAGIEFEGAENVSDRVAISLGPAPAAEVLSAIFSGSKFDFVAIGRPDSPDIVQRVILTRKSQPGEVAGTQPQPPANHPPNGEDEDVPDETVNGGGDPQDTPVQPVPVPQAQQSEPPQAQQPKSPEQLLQELQEMRRQKGSPEDSSPPPPRKPPTGR